MNKSRLSWNRLFLTLLATAPWLLYLPSIHGQASQSPPAVKPIPPNTRWTVKLTALKDASPSEGQSLKEIHGERSATMRYELLSWGDSKTERWYTGRFLLETALNRNDIIPTPFSKNSKQLEKRLGELSELNWISSGVYRGLTEYNGMTCHLFDYTLIVKPEIDSDILEAVKAGKIEMPTDMIFNYKAWIEVSTGLPAAMENNDYLYEYKFSSEEEDIKLSLPASFLRAAQKIDPGFAP